LKEGAPHFEALRARLCKRYSMWNRQIDSGLQGCFRFRQLIAMPINK
jgi:hypothetical protein